MVNSPAKPSASAVRHALKPHLPKAALYETVAERLRQRILGHQVGPGSWIDEQALAAEFGISRTPLREALKVLASEGLVTMKLRRGAYVTEVSSRDLTEVFHLLALLEGDAAATVARIASTEQMHELEGLHLELETTQHDRDAFFAANERFHLHLLDLASNRWGKQVATDLRRVMKLNRHHSLFKQGRIDASLREHREILVALLARDPERAQYLMREHIAKGEEAARSPAAP